MCTLGWVYWVIVWVIAWFSILLTYFVLLLFAHWLTSSDETERQNAVGGCKQIENWQTIKGHRIWPISVILLLVLIYYAGKYSAVLYHNALVHLTTIPELIKSNTPLWLIIVWPAIMLLFVSVRAFFRSDTYKLLKELKKDAKLKFCRKIKLIDGEEDSAEELPTEQFE